MNNGIFGYHPTRTTETFDFMSKKEIAILKHMAEQCNKNSIKKAVSAMGMVKESYFNKEISIEEHVIRIDDINNIITRFIKECSCGTRFK